MNRIGIFALVLGLCLTSQQVLAQTPTVGANGVLNAASYAQPGVLAPGMIFAIFGTSLSDGTSAAADLGASPLPTRLAGARVLVNAVPTPLIYVSTGLITAQFPAEWAGIATASLQVEVQSSAGTFTSAGVAITVLPYSPGIFTLDENGSGPGTISRASDFNTICPPGRNDCSANPAIPGEVISIYLTGLGEVNTSGGSTVATPQVTVGGTQAQVLFSGLNTASGGVYRVDAILPANLSPGDTVPLSVSIGSAASNQVTVPIGTAGAPSAQPDAQPGGGAVTALAADPVHQYTLYAGTADSGVFKSTDAGQSWTPASSGLPMAPVSVLVIDPSNSAVVYAGIHQSGPNDGAFKSTDGGGSWVPIRNGLTRGIGALVIDPNNPGTLYANTLNNGLFKSIDGGESWTAVNASGNALALDPTASGTIYVANSQGVFKSADGAASWTFQNNDINRPVVFTLAIDPLNPSTLYAGTNGGVFTSSDGGAAWSATGLPYASVSALAIDPLHTSTIFAGAANDGGVLKTIDGGTIWNTTSIASGSVNALVIDALNPSIIYAATSFGFSRSLDGGANWSVARSAVTATSVTALAIDPVNSGTLYVGAQGRSVLKSIDGGTTWTTPVNVLLGASITILAIDPLNPATVYAAASGGGVFRSIDGGQNWKPVNSGFPGIVNTLRVETLAVDPRNPATLYAGIAVGPGGLFRSVDGGDNWTQLGGITLGAVQALAIDPRNTSTLYAGGPSGPPAPNAFLAKSTNAGAAWNPLNSTPQPLSRVLIDPQNSSIVYVQTSVGITLKSTDGGGGFNYIGHGTPPITAMAIDPVNSATLYTGKGGGVVYKSTDGGGSWTLANSGLPVSASIIELAVDPHNSATLYAASSSQGVFKSTDGGATWQPTGLN